MIPLVSLIRPAVDFLFGGKFRANLPLAFELAFIVAGIWFVLMFAWLMVRAILLQPALDVLNDEPLESDLTKPALSGFVATEYFWLILNRTYVIFIAPEGLYGWMACGPVTNSNPTYYEPYREMLKDRGLMHDRRAIERLARLRGGFFIERSAIASVAFDERSKWGMGGILHSGRIRLSLRTGKSREFILLGVAYGDEIRDQISGSLGIGTSSAIQV